jgi:hypothetical protein
MTLNDRANQPTAQELKLALDIIAAESRFLTPRNGFTTRSAIANAAVCTAHKFRGAMFKNEPFAEATDT